ncbi:MAG: RNA methyltransferase [Puniceicoccales bacterium]|jgi:TrmH family RNA methyltransferase|nr:RNA methyltransferase [Puniceicoccales bacterium]
MNTYLESPITSRQNPRIQALANLRERRERDSQKKYLIEGLRELSRALSCGMNILEVYFCPALFKNTPDAQLMLQLVKQGGISLCEIGKSAFEKASGREGMDGLLGVAAMRDRHGLDELQLPPMSALILVVEAVEKPGNLGALFRVADSAGCSALICCDAVVDIYNPSVIRASQGALFSMQCAVATTQETIRFLLSKKIKVFATTPDSTKQYWDVDYKQSAAIILGSEKEGLSKLWLTEHHGFERISIPQEGSSDSLNVGIAGAICLYEALRQRRLGN